MKWGFLQWWHARDIIGGWVFDGGGITRLHRCDGCRKHCGWGIDVCFSFIGLICVNRVGMVRPITAPEGQHVDFYVYGREKMRQDWKYCFACTFITDIVCHGIVKSEGISVTGIFAALEK